jgi:hypothetical protein
MKPLRIFTLLLGLGAIVFTGLKLWHTVDIRPATVLIGVISMWPVAWFFLLKTVFSNPTALFIPDVVHWLYLVVIVSSPFIAIAMAGRLDRSRLDWFLLTLFFPYGLAALPLLPRGRASTNPYGGVIGRFLAVCTGKNCGRCGKAVPLSSRAGGRCPFCNVYWSSESTVYRN